ncbi:hypothetical protein Y1Q_0004224 [Alligator mississippiensis]|uniref:ribonuclease H n=1 Tax=Alligator mississippiensis TaxID=8496 RepID=A0A151M7I9_ALLMI|nr:hypothetical protein Y1Q_0004224 [Alligator mississippiensis]
MFPVAYVEKKWLTKTECQNISQPFCKLTRETEDFTEYYYSRARAVALNGYSSDWFCSQRFKSEQHSNIGAPEMKYIPNVRSIKFLIQPPYTLLKDEDDHQLIAEDSYSLVLLLRMPMGISPTPEVFQWKLNQELEGLPGIKIVADDILVIREGDDKEKVIRDHDAKLQQLLNRCRERNIKLNANKIQLRRPEVLYIGHLLTLEGLWPDPEKVKAIMEMPRPQDVKGIQCLIGMVNCPNFVHTCVMLVSHSGC